MKTHKRNDILLDLLIELRDGGNGHHTISNVYDWILDNFRNNEEKSIKRYNKAVAHLNKQKPNFIFTSLFSKEITEGLRIAAGLKKSKKK